MRQNVDDRRSEDADFDVKQREFPAKLVCTYMIGCVLILKNIVRCIDQFLSSITCYLNYYSGLSKTYASLEEMTCEQLHNL